MRWEDLPPAPRRMPKEPGLWPRAPCARRDNRDADETLASQTAEARNAVSDPVLQSRLGIKRSMARRALLGTRPFQLGKPSSLFQNWIGIAENTRDHLMQPLMLVGQDNGKAACF